jgi:fused signal recognition particle receptor
MSDGILVLVIVIVIVVVGAVGVLAITGLRRRGDSVPPRRAPERARPATRGAELKERPVAPPPPAVEQEVEAPPEAVEVPEAPPERLKPPLSERLAKSRRFLTGRLAEALGQTPDEETWEDVEAVLIQADIGVETATRIVGDLKELARERRIRTSEEVLSLLSDELIARFDEKLDRSLRFADGAAPAAASDGGAAGGVKPASSPTVWLVVGVNGTGKTTTIGKLAYDLRVHGKRVAMAAADTFRAAAEEQLGVWGERADAQIVKHQPGADPGAVAFDAFQFARARKLDVLIVDTAGRLHTKTPLMDELAKVRRVIEKEGRVDEALLVIDATAGQNGLNQAREFAESAGITGVVLTKLDGTAKGGIALAIETTLGIPIKLIGVGEGINDLEPFDPPRYVDALLS